MNAMPVEPCDCRQSGTIDAFTASAAADEHLAELNPVLSLRGVYLVLVVLCLIGVLLAASPRETKSSESFSGKSHVVREGDTLWEIAVQYFPTTDPRRAVDEIRAINEIGPEIYPGQEVILP